MLLGALLHWRPFSHSTFYSLAYYLYWLGLAHGRKRMPTIRTNSTTRKEKKMNQ